MNRIRSAYITSLILCNFSAVTLFAQDREADSAQVIIKYTDPDGWTNTVYFLDLENWMPLPGTITNSGFIIYQGGWGWSILRGLAETESGLESFFWDIDGDKISEVIVMFSDDAETWGEINRITIDSNYRPILQTLKLPTVDQYRTLDEIIHFNPFEKGSDGTLNWKMGPNPDDAIYQVFFNSEENRLELKLIDSSSK